MNRPRNGKRVIITAEYLAHAFPSDDPILYLAILAPFTESADVAEPYFAARSAELREAPDGPGKADAIDFWFNLGSAYAKLSVFERERIKRDLPKEIIKVLNERRLKKGAR